MADGFEVKYHLNPHDAGDAVLDPDNDGLTNLVEFQIGTDPTVANSGIVLSGTPLSGQLTSETILLPDTTYQVTGNLELANGATLRIAPGARLEFDANTNLTICIYDQPLFIWSNSRLLHKNQFPQTYSDLDERVPLVIRDWVKYHSPSFRK